MFSRVTSELQDSSQQIRLLNQTTRFFLCLIKQGKKHKTNESSAEAAAILFWRDKHSSPVFNAKTVRGLGTSHCNAPLEVLILANPYFKQKQREFEISLVMLLLGFLKRFSNVHFSHSCFEHQRCGYFVQLRSRSEVGF